MAKAKHDSTNTGWLRRRWLAIPLACLLLGAGAFIGGFVHHQLKPRVAGKTAGEWFAVALEDPSGLEQAARAMGRLDSASVPVLIDALRAENGGQVSPWAKYYARLPAWLARRIDSPESPRRQSSLALQLFIELSRESRRRVTAAVFDHYRRLILDPATPERTRLLVGYLAELEPSLESFAPLVTGLLDDPDPGLRQSAVALIPRFAHPRDGTGDRFGSATEPLVRWLLRPETTTTNREPLLRALAAIGPAAVDAVPAIESLAIEPGHFDATARALWWIDWQTNRVVGMVGERIDSDVEAVMIIGDLGPAGKPFLPKLKQSINHPKIEIAFAAVEAIARLDPGEAALIDDALLAWVRHPRTPPEFAALSVETLVERRVTSPAVETAIMRREKSMDRHLARVCRDALVDLATIRADEEGAAADAASD